MKCPRSSASKATPAQLALSLCEIRKEESGVKFRRGVTEYPLIGDPVVMVSADALQLIFGRTGAQNIVIGRLQQEPTLALAFKSTRC